MVPITKEIFIAFTLTVFLATGCQKSEPPEVNHLVFTVNFDANQARLDNRGRPATLPAGHAAQTPAFKELSVHYIELANSSATLLGKGAVIYKAEEVDVAGKAAIDFEKSKVAGNNEEFIRIPIGEIPPGNYEYIRASVSYQKYDITYNINNVPNVGNLMQQTGTLLSFVGFNTFIKNITPRQQTLTVNADMPQGYWVFETNLQAPYTAFNKLYFGQAPAGATTVVNPIAESSPIPPGSCVITGKLQYPLVITGLETKDIVVRLSFSTNNSFEWIDDNGNGQLDFYSTFGIPHEKVVDMGLRGLIPSIQE